MQAVVNKSCVICPRSSEVRKDEERSISTEGSSLSTAADSCVSRDGGDYAGSAPVRSLENWDAFQLLVDGHYLEHPAPVPQNLGPVARHLINQHCVY